MFPSQSRKISKKRRAFLLFPVILFALPLLYWLKEVKFKFKDTKIAVSLASSPSAVWVNLTLKQTTTMIIAETSTKVISTSQQRKNIRDDDTAYFDYLKILKKTSIKEQRERITNEMQDFNSSGNTCWQNLIMENGGEPVRSVIFSTWRSGSTFLGDLLNSYPATFYHYEPLLHLGVQQVRGMEAGDKAMKILEHLLTCNYSDIDEFNNWQTYVSPERNQQNRRIWKFCQKKRKICKDPQFLSDMCKLFPFQSMKTVRMRLRWGKSLLEKFSSSIHLLLLVRDPRAVIESRRKRDWCSRGSDCSHPEVLCRDMEEDYKFAQILRRHYPDKFIALRYEDISLHPFSATKKLLQFFHLEFHADVNYFLKTHTVKNHGGVTSTYRDSSKTPFSWVRELYNSTSRRKDIDTEILRLQSIQAICGNVLKYWGYKTLPSNTSQFVTFHPLRRPPWPEMLILN